MNDEQQRMRFDQIEVILCYACRGWGNTRLTPNSRERQICNVCGGAGRMKKKSILEPFRRVIRQETSYPQRYHDERDEANGNIGNVDG